MNACIAPWLDNSALVHLVPPEVGKGKMERGKEAEHETPSRRGKCDREILS